jgi:hypothetical protein
MEMPRRFRSSLRSLTISAQISALLLSFDTPVLLTDYLLDSVYHYNDNLTLYVYATTGASAGRCHGG